MSRPDPSSAHTPRLSVVVVAYEMQREILRTIRSLSPGMQRGVRADDYEIIVVDNGSRQPIDRGACEAFGAHLRWQRIDDASRSPARAANLGISNARAPLVGMMIDGARIASPGLLHHALVAARVHRRPVIATHGLHLGPDVQQRSVARGYDQDAEDELLASIDWTSDPYRLFDVSVFAESSKWGWFEPPAESNALFLPARLWEELDGYDEAFRSPGGGLVNLDLFERACSLPRVRTIMLLGEASFHQVHGGTSTNAPTSRWNELHAEYVRLRGKNFRVPKVRPLYIGTLTPHAVASLMASRANEIDSR